MVGWRTEAVPCRGRHLGEKDFLAISVRMIARSSRATLLSLSIISLQIADIMAATELEQPSMAGYDVTEGRYKVNSEKQKTSFPTLRTILGEYLARVKTALNPHYDDVSATVFKMRDKYS